MHAEGAGLYLQQKDEEREDTNTKREYGSVYRRRTNYNITTKITTKRQTIIYQTLFLELMIEQQEPH